MEPRGEIGPDQSLIPGFPGQAERSLLEHYREGLELLGEVPEVPDDRFDEALDAVSRMIIDQSNIVVISTEPTERHPDATQVSFELSYHTKDYEVIVGENGASVRYVPSPAEGRFRFLRFNGNKGPHRAVGADLADVLRMILDGEVKHRRTMVASTD